MSIRKQIEVSDHGQDIDATQSRGGKRMNEGQGEQQSCGQGLAANAVILERVAKLLEATANALENHTRSLEPKAANSNQELKAYERLVREHRASAAQLSALAESMKSYRGLPVVEHDMSVLTDARSIDVLDSLVRAQQDVRVPLRERVAEHSEMLKASRRV
jgi:hypothetical protein